MNALTETLPRVSPRSSGWARAVIITVLIAATLGVYHPVLHFDYVNLDDPTYAQSNHHVIEGLNAQGVVWAFTTTDGAHWHPLTWLSLMADATIFGADPRVFHGTNLLLHILNTLLLFSVLERMTRALWRSGFVAALFAIHPLHVESVAWISERKDVLSTLFWFVTMLAYQYYAERPGRGRSLIVAASFSLGLMSKSMLVTLPLILLLLDYWPLERLAVPGRARREGEKPLSKLLLEKTPLFALSLASCVIVVFAQRSAGALRTLEQFPLTGRVANAIVTFILYVWQAVLPRGLAVYYPYPRLSPPPLTVALCAVAMVGCTFLALRAAHARRYAAVGWLWYVVTVLPVIGVVQVGSQARADRYTYIPLVGIFIAATWTIADVVLGRVAPGRHSPPAQHLVPGRGRASGSVPPDSRLRLRRGALALAGAIAICAFAYVAHIQVGYWKDTVTLLTHALDVTTDNAVAHNNLGIELYARGAAAEAAVHWRAAVSIDPRYPDALANLAGVLLAEGKAIEAEATCRRALTVRPENAGALMNLGLALMRQGKLEEAIAAFSASLAVRPEHSSTRNDLGVAFVRQGKLDEAARQFNEILKKAPEFAEARANLGIVLMMQNHPAEAVRQLNEALRIDPYNDKARRALSSAMERPQETH